LTEALYIVHTNCNEMNTQKYVLIKQKTVTEVHTFDT